MANARIVGEVVLNVNPAGIGKNPVGRPKAEIDEAKVRDLYVTQALPLAEVAATLGVAVLTLRKRLEDFGIEARKRGRPVKRRVLEAREGVITLNGSYAEPEAAQNALVELYATEAAEIAAKAEAEAAAAETPAEA